MKAPLLIVTVILFVLHSAARKEFICVQWSNNPMGKGRSVYDVYGNFGGLTKIEPPEEVRVLNATLQDFRDDTTDLAPVPMWANHPTRADDLRKYCEKIGEEDGFTVLNTVRGYTEVIGWVEKDAIMVKLKAREDE